LIEGRAYPYAENIPYFPLIDLLNRSWGGHVAKNLGDGLLIYFGWPTAEPQTYRPFSRRETSAGRAAGGASAGRSPLAAALSGTIRYTML